MTPTGERNSYAAEATHSALHTGSRGSLSAGQDAGKAEGKVRWERGGRGVDGRGGREGRAMGEEGRRRGGYHACRRGLVLPSTEGTDGWLPRNAHLPLFHPSAPPLSPTLSLSLSVPSLPLLTPSFPSSPLPSPPSPYWSMLTRY